MKAILTLLATTSFLLIIAGSATAGPEVVVKCDDGDGHPCVCDFGNLIGVNPCGISGYCPVNDPHLAANALDDAHQCVAAFSPVPPP